MKIIATVGPACPDTQSIAALKGAGADQIRLNASHLDEDSLAAVIHQVSKGGFPPAEVIVDLQGGKTRLGVSDRQLTWFAGERVRLGGGPESGWPWVDRPAFLHALRPGDCVRIDDGRIELRVEELATESVRALVLEGGAVLPRKGVTLAGRTPDLAVELLPGDRAAIEVARSLGVESFAVSYANVAAQVELVREVVKTVPVAASRESVEIIAKIEHPLAIENLAQLAGASDLFWLCRGDLGAEVGIEHLPRYQAQVFAAVAGTPLVVAGQVLHHLTKSPRPTRSEACHVAEMVWRGAVGFVLSDETATGPHGVEAVTWLRRLVEAASLR